LELDNNIIPIEIKSTTNVKSSSLKWYIKQYKPTKAIRLSLLNYSRNETLYEIPLYLVCKLVKQNI
jgi:hypothetical protein